MSDYPRISVLLPVKKRLERFAKALESVLEQTYDNFELIIVDDSENGVDTSFLKDIRLKYFRSSNKNLPAALNFGLSRCSCEIIARMDGDDFCRRDRFEKQIVFLKENNLHAAGCNLVYIGDDDRVILKKRFPESSESVRFYMPVTTSLPHPALMTYKSVLEKAGGYNEELSYAEDQDLFLRMMKSGARLGNVQEFMYFYRIRNEIMDTYNEDSAAGFDTGMRYVLERDNSDCSDEERNEILLQKALIEYYKGDVRSARKHFLRLFGKKPSQVFKYGRHLALSMGGNKFIRYLRRKKLPHKINFFAIKFLKYDMQFIKKN